MLRTSHIGGCDTFFSASFAFPSVPQVRFAQMLSIESQPEDAVAIVVAADSAAPAPASAPASSDRDVATWGPKVVRSAWMQRVFTDFIGTCFRMLLPLVAEHKSLVRCIASSTVTMLQLCHDSTTKKRMDHSVFTQGIVFVVEFMIRSTGTSVSVEAPPYPGSPSSGRSSDDIATNQVVNPSPARVVDVLNTATALENVVGFVCRFYPNYATKVVHTIAVGALDLYGFVVPLRMHPSARLADVSGNADADDQNDKESSPPPKKSLRSTRSRSAGTASGTQVPARPSALTALPNANDLWRHVTRSWSLVSHRLVAGRSC